MISGSSAPIGVGGGPLLHGDVRLGASGFPAFNCEVKAVTLRIAGAQLRIAAVPGLGNGRVDLRVREPPRDLRHVLDLEPEVVDPGGPAGLCLQESHVDYAIRQIDVRAL